jgi:hypothetical protein
MPSVVTISLSRLTIALEAAHVTLHGDKGLRHSAHFLAGFLAQLGHGAVKLDKASLHLIAKLGELHKHNAAGVVDRSCRQCIRQSVNNKLYL